MKQATLRRIQAAEQRWIDRGCRPMRKSDRIRQACIDIARKMEASMSRSAARRTAKKCDQPTLTTAKRKRLWQRSIDLLIVEHLLYPTASPIFYAGLGRPPQGRTVA